jgi:oxygen-independent coproporphyrinogen-3 oxidase
MATDAGFAIYVHWPFCLAKCPYCDFNSHVREAVDQTRWRAALSAEIDHYAAQTADRRVTSIFFGGGTPSLMQPEMVAGLIDRIGSSWSLDPAVEITLEANPTSVEAARFARLAEAGVNRLSLGVQALDDAALAFLGREHNSGEALAALDVARRYFHRYSFDLIYARPDQSPVAWQAELGRALDLVGDHLSVYQLTIEPGTAFHTRHRLGALAVPDEDTAAALYETTNAMLSAAGLPAYEISNHARPAGACRHNLTYWRGGDWVGVGPGAHGRLTVAGNRFATDQTRAPEAWLKQVEERGHGSQRREKLTTTAHAEETLMMGLRLAEGVDRGRFRATVGVDLGSILEPARLADLVEAGYIEVDDESLRTTAAGRLRLNAVLAHLLI